MSCARHWPKTQSLVGCGLRLSESTLEQLMVAADIYRRVLSELALSTHYGPESLGWAARLVNDDVLVALGKIQASALDFLRAATPFAAPGDGGTVPAPAEAAASTGAPTAAAPQAASPAPAAAPAGRRNLVHKTHRTHTVSAPP